MKHLLVLLSLCLSFILFSCSDSGENDPKNDVDDIKVLYTIYQANPNSGLYWEFDVTDPKIIEMKKSIGVTFETIDGKQRVTELRINGLGTYVNGNNITDLTAIAGLTELRYLDCSFIGLTTLDVSKNEKLEYLNCIYTPLGSLDVSKNRALTYLDCAYNKLGNKSVKILKHFHDNENSTLYPLRGDAIYDVIE